MALSETDETEIFVIRSSAGGPLHETPGRTGTIVGKFARSARRPTTFNRGQRSFRSNGTQSYFVSHCTVRGPLRKAPVLPVQPVRKVAFSQLESLMRFSTKKKKENILNK